MRIGIDIGPVLRSRTGVGNYCYYLLKHLLMQAPGDRFAGLSSGLGRANLGVFQGTLSHRHIPLPTRALYRVWNLTGRPRADRLLGGVEVFHATNYFLPPVASARRILTIYDVAFLVAPELASPKIVGPFTASVRRFAREADAVLTCSEASKRDICAHTDIAPEKITVAYGAVDERFGPVDCGEARRHLAERYGVSPPFFLFVSTLEPRKNVVGLLEAFAEAARSAPHQLVLLGRMGWHGEQVQEALARLDLGGRVRLIGYVENHLELPLFYSGADALVFPSFYEGFGLPVLEAMTCGCPVITARNSSLPEVAGTAALYCDAEDREGLTSAMLRVAEDELCRRDLAARGYEQVRRFSWRDTAATVLELYRRLAAC